MYNWLKDGFTSSNLNHISTAISWKEALDLLLAFQLSFLEMKV